MAVLFKDVVGAQSQEGMSPLHEATLDDSVHQINELLEPGADLNARDRDGATPLHWAAAGNSHQAVERLIQAGASPNARSSTDSTPLHWGAAYGATEAVDRLLEAGADANARDEQGDTALHSTGSSLSPATVERLLEAGADPNARNRQQETPLHVAHFSLAPDAVERLIQAGADPDARNHLGRTPLHRATHAGAIRSMDVLLQGGANPDSRDDNGRTALHNAAELNTPHVAERLLQAGADVNARDNQGVTPLHYSAAAWASDTVDRLLEAGADPQAQDKERKLTPLHHAIEQDRLEVVDRLLEAGTDPNTRDSEDSTLLHQAARTGSPEMVERLLAAGADPHARDNQGRTVLHWASNPNLHVDWNRLSLYDTDDRVAVIDHLIKAGAPVNARDGKGRTALHEAATQAPSKVADRLIQAGAIVNVRDDQGRTALHVAAMQGSSGTASRLLEAGTDPDVRDNQGKTALEYGTEKEPVGDMYRKVFKEHQERQGQQQPAPAAKQEEKEPPREPSPAQPEPPAMEHRADDVNAVDQYGDTALHRAAENGSVTRIHQLLHAGANLEARDEYGATPLHRALASDHPEAVERLLEARADHQARDSNGDTPLHYAAAARSPALTDRLLQAGADPHARNNDGATPLHAVTEHPTHIEPSESSIKTVDRLAKAGADLNAQDKAGNTALHFLAEGRKPAAGELTEAFLERGARLDIENAQGRSPLETTATGRSAVKRVNARLVRGVLEQHQARKERPQQSVPGEKDQRRETGAARRDSPQQRGRQQPEQAEPEKRRWWRSRGKAATREGAGGKSRKPSRTSAQDYARQASEKVIKQLEKGVAPWQKPWDTPTGANEPPHNPVSKTRYKGLNAIVLRAESEEHGYSDPRWVTYKQAKELKAQVRKGERGTRIEYWKFSSVKEGKDQGEGQSAEDPSQTQERPILHRTYTVFNAEQIDNMPEREHSHTQGWEASERAERLLKESGADIVHVHGDRAFYRPSDDKIVMPKQEQFPTHEAYYSTALHEMGHWTGHKDRLDRETLREAVKPETGGYGSVAYAKEELRAEMTSMTVNGVMKLPHDPERHASYVKSWIKALSDDPNELRHAARDAGAAAEYLLQYDRDRPRVIDQPSRHGDVSPPMPEQLLSRRQEQQRQLAQGQEASLSR